MMRFIRRFRRLVTDFRAGARGAKQDTGKGIIAQLVEIIRLALFADGCLSPDEYYQYRLYDDSMFTWERKTEFFGRAMESRLVSVFKCREWMAVAHDKLMTTAFFERFGFPTPAIYAVYHPWRGYGETPVLRDLDGVQEHLRTTLHGPFVAKPVDGMWGRGVWAVESVDPARDEITLTNGERHAIPEFVAGLDDPAARRHGVLFQELLRTHPDLRPMCGERICSVRMVVLVDSDGPRFLSTLWKVATGGSMADNYWEPGNMVAPVDTESGVVGRLLSGLGQEIRYSETHPDTGATLVGLELPDWTEATRLCLDAAATLPGIPMQAWDIALTSRGPVLLEVNVNGGMRLPQLVAMRGLYHGEFRAFLERYGFPRY